MNTSATRNAIPAPHHGRLIMPAIANVIRQVSAEYGLTADKGYTVADPNLDELYRALQPAGRRLLGG